MARTRRMTGRRRGLRYNQDAICRISCIETLENRVMLSAASDPVSDAAVAATGVQSSGIGIEAITNLLSNGSFENGTLSPWSTGTGITRDTTQFHDGVASVKLSGASTNQSIGTTVVGQQYKATVWVKLESQTGGTWGGFRVEIQDGSFATLAHSGYLTIGGYGTSWFQVGLNFTATSTTSRLYLGKFGDQTTLVGYCDQAMLFLKPAVNALPTIDSVSVSSVTALSPAQTQTFSATATDTDGAVKQVVWDFGDGGKAYLYSGTRDVTSTGSYIATVKAVDDNGGIGSATVAWTSSDPNYPVLTVNTPPTEVNSATLALSGTTTVSGGAVKISSDRDQLVNLTASGTNWSGNFTLLPGYNRITIQTISATGNITAMDQIVHYTPAAALSITGLTNAATVQQWDALNITFSLNNSAATNPDFAFGTNTAAGLQFIDGATVNGVFWLASNPGVTYTRPAFLYQPATRSLLNSQDWIYPTGTPVWTVRFAPPTQGVWNYYITDTEARGTAQSINGAFTTTAPTDPQNHGPISVSPTDSRYFQYADGTPFIGAGEGFSSNIAKFSYDGVDQLNAMGTGNEQLLRWWVSGKFWGSAWQMWSSKTVGYDGNVPATQLGLDSAFANGLAAGTLSYANPTLFQGFGSALPAIKTNTQYKVTIRWRLDNVTGPYHVGSSYGAVVKLTGWPTGPSVGDPAPINAGTTLINFEKGNSPWHVSESTYTTGSGTNYLGSPYLSIMQENTTGGTMYVDEIQVREVLAGGALGPNVLYDGKFNSQYNFEKKMAVGMDAIVATAQSRGIALKLVISEKAEYLLGHTSNEGFGLPAGGNFDGNGLTSANDQLHHDYWRWLSAWFGASRTIHSWEFVNEDDPNSGSNYRMAGELSDFAKADGNPHMGTTSSWAGLNQAQWKTAAYANISYADFHAYVRGTGFENLFGSIDSGVTETQLANDSARFFNDYDRYVKSQAIGKPVVWGEMGIDGTSGTNGEDPGLASDNAGIWLHKYIWARTGPGGVYPIYWYTSNINGKNLHHIYGEWNKFMAGIPLNNGSFVDIAGSSTNTNLRVIGQKDTVHGTAQVWIDNKTHTWQNVVSSPGSIVNQTGNVTFSMSVANATYNVSWYNPYTGLVTTTQQVTASAGGVVTLAVSNLATDTAARLVLQAQSAAPGAPDLDPTTDSGLQADDNKTNRDNSVNNAATILKFIVGSTVAGATVTIYADGTAIGSFPNSPGGSVTVTTTGTFDLTDGSHSITARQTETGKTESVNSSALSITIDTVAPTVGITAVSPDPRQTEVASMAINFSEAIGGFGTANLGLTRDGSGVSLATASLTSGNNIAWTLSNLNALTDEAGTYSLSTTGGGVTDVAGNALSGSASDTWVMNAINGTAGADAIALSRNAGNAALIDVSVNNGGLLSYSVDASAFPQLVIAAIGDDDVITLHLESALAAAALVVDGGTGSNDSLTVVTGAGADTITFNAADALVNGLPISYTGLEEIDLDVGGGGDTVAVNSGAAVTFTGTQHLASLNLSDTARANLTSAGTGVLVTDTLTMSPVATLDLAYYSLLVNTANVADIRALILAGHDNGSVGPGILSSELVPGVNGLGYAAGNDPNLLLPGGTLSGEPVGAGAVVVKFARLGDANLDGSVDGSDVSIWAQNFTGGLGVNPPNYKLWTQADWNYDGSVDGSDVSLWAQNFTGALGGGAGTIAPLAAAEPVATSPLRATPAKRSARQRAQARKHASARSRAGLGAAKGAGVFNWARVIAD